MKLLHLAFFVAASLTLSACENSNRPDGMKDALDARPNEPIRDAGEEVVDGVKDAGRELKDAVQDN